MGAGGEGLGVGLGDAGGTQLVICGHDDEMAELMVLQTCVDGSDVLSGVSRDSEMNAVEGPAIRLQLAPDSGQQPMQIGIRRG